MFRFMLRCPNCGKKVFSKIQKLLGMYTTFNKCPYCKARSQHRTYKNISLYYYISLIFVFYIIILAVIYIKFHNYISFTAIEVLAGLGIVFYVFYHYFCCHFDVYKTEKERCFGITNIILYAKKRPWPTIRYAEIYVIVPEELDNPNLEEFQTIAQLVKTEKNNSEAILRFKVIRNSEKEALKPNTEVKIINDFDTKKYRIVNGKLSK